MFYIGILIGIRETKGKDCRELNTLFIIFFLYAMALEHFLHKCMTNIYGK